MDENGIIFKRKLDDLDLEIGAQHKRIRLLESDLENLLDENRYLSDICENYEERISYLEKHMQTQPKKYNLRSNPELAGQTNEAIHLKKIGRAHI